MTPQSSLPLLSTSVPHSPNRPHDPATMVVTSLPVVPLVLSLFVLLSLLLLTLAHPFFFIHLNLTDDNGCGVGHEYRAGACQLCRPGTYRFLGPPDLPTRDPFTCPNDDKKYTEFKIEPSTSRCEKCPAGTYNPFRGAQASRRCRPCPEGKTSEAGSSKCVKCKPWQSSASGSPVCVRCGLGYSITAPCVRGVQPTQSCTKCPKGSYADAVNSVKCKKCTKGTGTRLRGATRKGQCKPCGTKGVKCSCREPGEPWRAVSSFRPIGQSMCEQCPAGTRALSPFATKLSDCKPCPNGTVFWPFDGCQPCPKGTKSFGAGANECREKWTDKCRYDSFKNSRGICKKCTAGYFWNTRKLECERCPEGTTAEGYVETSCRVCRFPNVVPPDRASCSCGPGYFMVYDDSFRCAKCPRGTKNEKMFHQHSQCDLDCAKFPDQVGCKKCGVDYERVNWDFHLPVSKTGCFKCKDGLRSLEGEERCVNPQTGCRANETLVIHLVNWGYALRCLLSRRLTGTVG